jgi:hypothetical protein
MKHFKDDPTTAVITTVYVVRQNSPILFIYHFDDGYWQFSGVEENLSDEDFMVVALEEITALDASVVSVADLPLGHMVSRKFLDDEWSLPEKID